MTELQEAFALGAAVGALATMAALFGGLIFALWVLPLAPPAPDYMPKSGRTVWKSTGGSRDPR